jgi:hypothetical protein
MIVLACDLLLAILRHRHRDAKVDVVVEPSSWLADKPSVRPSSLVVERRGYSHLGIPASESASVQDNTRDDSLRMASASEAYPSSWAAYRRGTAAAHRTDHHCTASSDLVLGLVDSYPSRAVGPPTQSATLKPDLTTHGLTFNLFSLSRSVNVAPIPPAFFLSRS